MRCFSRSMDAFITYGVRLIKKATSWTSWSKTKGQASREEVLSQVIERLEVCASCDHYRQVEELQCGQDRKATERRTSTTEVSEQPRREFASAHEIARACNEEIQVSWPRAAFSLSFGIINSHFRVGRHSYSAGGYRTVRKLRLASWDEAIASIVPAR